MPVRLAPNWSRETGDLILVKIKDSALCPSDPSEQPKNQNNDENRTQETMRSVAKSITAGREGSDQQQDDNDK